MEAVKKILNQYDIPEISPVEMVRESGDNHVYLIGEKNKKICAENSVGKIVLGKSLNYKGEPNPIMVKIEPFKMALEKETGLPVSYENETLTSAEARRPLGGERKRPPTLSKRKSPEKEKQARMKVDSSAATLILQSYLDYSSLPARPADIP